MSATNTGNEDILTEEILSEAMRTLVMRGHTQDKVLVAHQDICKAAPYFGVPCYEHTDLTVRRFRVKPWRKRWWKPWDSIEEYREPAAYLVDRSVFFTLRSPTIDFSGKQT
jgi:hypothetical protein